MEQQWRKDQQNYLRTMEFRIVESSLHSYKEARNLLEDFMKSLQPQEFKRYYTILRQHLPELEGVIDSIEYRFLYQWMMGIEIPKKPLYIRVEEEYFYLPNKSPDPPLETNDWNIQKFVQRYTFKCIKQFIKEEASKPMTFPNSSRLATIAKAFDLTERQTKILSLLYLLDSQDIYQRHIAWDNNINWLAHLYEVVFQESSRYFRQEYSKESKLSQIGFIHQESMELRPFQMNYFLDMPIFRYLSGTQKNFYSLNTMVFLDQGRFPIDSFSLSQTQLDLAQSIMNHPTKSGRILICGPPGSGKTEFIKSLLGVQQKALLFKSESERHYQYQFYLAATNAQNTGKVLVVDEAESILQTQKIMSFFEQDVLKNKKFLHDFLDTFTGKFVCIINDVQGIHESTLRRFDQIIQMPSPDTIRRSQMWQEMAKKKRIKLSVAFIKEISKTYQVTPGIIQRALDSAKLTAPKLREQTILESLNSFLQIQGKPPKTPHAKLPNNPALIHTDQELSQLVTMLEPWIPPKQTFGASLLFWGLPGTGKTEFAHTLAEQLGLESIQVSSSTILSPWVGEAEQNLARTFRQALDSNSLLIIDEVDSFLYQRNSQQRSWERSIVNEFLSQLERHPGITVCTTNLLTLLDDAALRRFNWKVEFKPLDKPRIEEGVKLYFPTFATKVIQTLTDLDEIPAITLGDLASTYKAIQPRITAGLPVEPEDIFLNLIRECKYRDMKKETRVLGFRGE